jgi:hypothetical protein
MSLIIYICDKISKLQTHSGKAIIYQNITTDDKTLYSNTVQERYITVLNIESIWDCMNMDIKIRLKLKLKLDTISIMNLLLQKQSTKQFAFSF